MQIDIQVHGYCSKSSQSSWNTSLSHASTKCCSALWGRSIYSSTWGSTNNSGSICRPSSAESVHVHISDNREMQMSNAEMLRTILQQILKVQLSPILSHRRGIRRASKMFLPRHGTHERTLWIWRVGRQIASSNTDQDEESVRDDETYRKGSKKRMLDRAVGMQSTWYIRFQVVLSRSIGTRDSTFDFSLNSLVVTLCTIQYWRQRRFFKRGDSTVSRIEPNTRDTSLQGKRGI
jgi:hypothetical protein